MDLTILFHWFVTLAIMSVVILIVTAILFGIKDAYKFLKDIFYND